ncbi:MAG: flagellar basal body-associated protein FliL [Ramlibacter sp.]
MKANSKSKGDAKDDGGSSGGKGKLIAIVGAAVLLLGGGGGAAAYFMSGHNGGEAKEHKAEKAEPPEYIAIEPFTVNLQPENGDQYLQVQFTLQVANAETAEQIKANMAMVRSRVLMILSAKHASEINTVEGKQLLAKQIVDSIRQPFFKGGQPQKVGDVLFTAFIIQ